LQRAVEGVLVPVIHRGRIIGWRRKYDNRILANMLRARIANGGLELIS
jgi:hypothetical protein